MLAMFVSVGRLAGPGTLIDSFHLSTHKPRPHFCDLFCCSPPQEDPPLDPLPRQFHPVFRLTSNVPSFKSERPWCFFFCSNDLQTQITAETRRFENFSFYSVCFFKKGRRYCTPESYVTLFTIVAPINFH